MTPIKRLAKGQAPTPLEEKYFNEIVDLLNALATMQVNPAGFGTVQVGARNVILDCSAFATDVQNRLKALEDGSTAVNVQIQQILNALQQASARATCNPDGSVTITFTFPGV
jgi:hypothetical protein